MLDENLKLFKLEYNQFLYPWSSFIIQGTLNNKL
jgi:hypothetical protein